jgi:large subunit ribosomal protein L10
VNTLNKEEKIRIVSELQEKFEKAKGIVFTDYRGLNVEEITDLRNSLRSSAVEYKVVKNTLAKIAAEGTPADGAKDSFTGPVGIAVGYDDPVLVVKKVLEFSKANEKLEVKGGVVEGGVCTPGQLKAISELPPREVQLSMLVGAMQSPLSNMAGLLNATLTQFMYAMEALKNKKNEN